MTRLIILIAFIIPIIGFSQVTAPTNIYFTVNEISGNANPETIIKIDRNVGVITGLPIISAMVNSNGYFSYTFETPLPLLPGPPIAQPVVRVWAEDTNRNQSAVNTYTALTAENALQQITSGVFVLPVNRRITQSTTIVNPEIDGAQAPSTTFKYKVKMLNTNFTIPLARFNFINDNSDLKKGEILLFNSIGAGIGISWGEIEKTTDATGATINTDFTNTFGIHLGVLFSSGKDGAEQKNVFAPTMAISILDFQLGAGYELGTINQDQKRTFVTLAYAIPLSKLVKGKFYIFRASKGYNDKNPLVTPTNGLATTSKQRFIQ